MMAVVVGFSAGVVVGDLVVGAVVVVAAVVAVVMVAALSVVASSGAVVAAKLHQSHTPMMLNMHGVAHAHIWHAHPTKQRVV